MPKVKAKLLTINPAKIEVLNHQEICDDWVKRYVRMAKRSPIPPILLIVREMNQVILLDGHHRIAAARKLGIKIKAWTVQWKQVARAWQSHLWSDSHDDCDDFCCLDARIYCDGKRYSDTGLRI